ENLGSKVHAPGIGFSIGEDRLVMSVESLSGDAEAGAAALDLVVAPVGEPALRHAAVMAREFRLQGHSVELIEGKLKRAMELANKFGARFALIVGDNEMAAGRYALKDMTTGQQEELTREEITSRLAVSSNSHLNSNS